MILLCGILLRKFVPIDLFVAELYELWRAFQRKKSMLQDCPSCMMISIVGRNFFFTQLIKFYSCLFEDAISCIFLSKNLHLASCIVDLEAFQFNRLLS